MSSKEETKRVAEAEAEAAQMTGTDTPTGPEASGQQNAATLEEAMALQDKLAREANGTTEEAAPAEE